MSARLRMVGLAVVGLFALGVSAACAPPPLLPGVPRLLEMRFDGQAERNPLVLLFSIDFEDSDADLASGVLRPYVNDRATQEDPLTLADLMLSSNVASDASAGELRFNLEVEMELDPTKPAHPSAGATFSVGVEVYDGSGNVSNRPSVTLQISYP